jgi:hypothetical protein
MLDCTNTLAAMQASPAVATGEYSVSRHAVGRDKTFRLLNIPVRELMCTVTSAASAQCPSVYDLQAEGRFAHGRNWC